MAIAASEPVDLPLSDFRPKDGTGWDLMTRMRAIRRVPGIMLSGCSAQAYVDKSRNIGFDEYMVKPVDQEVLCGRVAELIDRRKAER